MKKVRLNFITLKSYSTQIRDESLLVLFYVYREEGSSPPHGPQLIGVHLKRIGHQTREDEIGIPTLPHSHRSKRCVYTTHHVGLYLFRIVFLSKFTTDKPKQLGVSLLVLRLSVYCCTWSDHISVDISMKTCY